MVSSISDTNKYKNFCAKISADDNAFSTFRQSQVFCEIMEHVGVDVANECVKHLKGNPILKNISKFKTNDDVGSPAKFNFAQPFGKMATTTIRYVKILNDIYEMFGNLSGKHVVEIGAGYGGQAKIIHDIFDVASYSVVDLPESLGVVEKYLSKFDINAKLFTSDNLPDVEYDLIISNYAFSECNRDIQDIYINKILSKSKNGYMICNFISEKFGISSYSDSLLISTLNKALSKKITVEPEHPLTFTGNVLVSW